MARKTVADLVVETLVLAGVRRIYGVAGDSLNGITDSIRRRNDIQWTSMRHEEAGAFAAGAEAHLTGTLAACAGSCGPGNLHLINGLFDAHRSRVPVVAIAAQIISPEIGSNYFQETHPERLFRDCSHYCEVISHTNQTARIVEIAVRTALALRGVSVIVLPGDVALSESVAAEPPLTLTPLTNTIPSDDEIGLLADTLNRGKRITVLAGAGCAGAHDELIDVAAKLGAPIVHTIRGKEFVEYDNPFDVGMTGLLGFSSGYYAMMNADTLLMLGTDFPYRQFYPDEAKVVQVDVRGDQIGRRTRVDVPIVGDVKATLTALSPRLHSAADDTHLRKARNHYVKARKGLDELATGTPGRKPIHPQFVARTLNELAREDAVFTCDVGTPTIWAARYLSMNGKRRLLGSFNHGSMANALPQAIGAQCNDPKRQVIALSGDGGLAMLLGDLLTLHQHDLPVKVVVFQNDALSFVELEMKAAGFLPFATQLKNPSFAAIASASGMLGLTATVPEDVRPMLTQALEYEGPALVEVLVNRQELSIPPTIQREQAKGFGMYLVRAVLNGRADEIVELAKTNIFR